MRITKEDIADFRGGIPTLCDFCHQPRTIEELEPEEAGDWACHDCLRKWLARDVDAIKAILECVYDETDAAKWWFTPQSYLSDRTPHELILSDQSDALLYHLTHFAEGKHV
jgi:hypothetical protein